MALHQRTTLRSRTALSLRPYPLPRYLRVPRPPRPLLELPRRKIRTMNNSLRLQRVPYINSGLPPRRLQESFKRNPSKQLRGQPYLHHQRSMRPPSVYNSLLKNQTKRNRLLDCRKDLPRNNFHLHLPGRSSQRRGRLSLPQPAPIEASLLIRTMFRNHGNNLIHHCLHLVIISTTSMSTSHSQGRTRRCP